MGNDSDATLDAPPRPRAVQEEDGRDPREVTSGIPAASGVCIYCGRPTAAVARPGGAECICPELTGAVR